MIKSGDNVILKFDSIDGELSRYKGKAYVYESMDTAVKYLKPGEKNALLLEYIPVKRGSWKDATGSRIICSHCGEYPLYDYFGRQQLSRYCSNCGARMNLED